MPAARKWAMAARGIDALSVLSAVYIRCRGWFHIGGIVSCQRLLTLANDRLQREQPSRGRRRVHIEVQCGDRLEIVHHWSAASVSGYG